MCRICMSDKAHLRGIHQTRIPKMLETCASVEVSENDGLPANICVTCFHMVNKFYIFKKKIEHSDKVFRQHVKKQMKQRDILNIAITEAHINENNNSTGDEEKISDEDIPLSKRLIKYKNEVRSNDYKLVHNEVFDGGPPPLVPLALEKKTEVEKVVLNLPEDTPPLIPIKPLSNLVVLEHIVPKLENLEYKCNGCAETFVEVTAFKDHKLACRANILQCNICKKEFQERKKLIGHLKGHMVVKDYRCKICGKLYPNPSTLRVHVRSHTGERPFRCPTCHKGFVRWAGVVGHMKTHEDEKPFACETCGRAFKVASNLERHKRLHTGVMPFTCNICNKNFSQSENLQLHIRTYHTNERPYLCNECGKRFVNSTRLNRHMWIHSGYKPYVCQYCAKSYSNSNDLKNHELHHHQGKSPEEFKNYACNICNRKFFHSCRLARHKKIHENKYQCQFCYKSYSTENLLYKHLIQKHDVGLSISESEMSKFYVEYKDVVDLEKQESVETSQEMT
ncbi:hypothetical protein JTB14_031698 [Gonioctena quinquepunctata]|nr:hypothetical protein JTB14_031698 [Gonioctena quinquepunctata]